MLYIESDLSTDIFFFNDTATTEIYTLSLHDALLIWNRRQTVARLQPWPSFAALLLLPDRKSTRLNSSHPSTSYAVFCLKKKNKHEYRRTLVKRGGSIGANATIVCAGAVVTADVPSY